MKWIKSKKYWFYVGADDSIIDRIIYEDGMYQSFRYTKSFYSVEGMKKYVEDQYAMCGKIIPVDIKEKTDPMTYFLRIVTYGLLTFLFLLLITIIFCGKANADAKDIRDMLNTFAPAPRVVYIQPSSIYPTPPAYLPPVIGQVLEPVDFMPARLYETPSINLYGDSNE